MPGRPECHHCQFRDDPTVACAGIGHPRFCALTDPCHPEHDPRVRESVRLISLGVPAEPYRAPGPVLAPAGSAPHARHRVPLTDAPIVPDSHLDHLVRVWGCDYRTGRPEREATDNEVRPEDLGRPLGELMTAPDHRAPAAHDSAVPQGCSCSEPMVCGLGRFGGRPSARQCLDCVRGLSGE